MMLTGRRSDTLPRQSTAIPCISLWNFFLGKCEVDTTRAFMTNSNSHTQRGALTVTRGLDQLTQEAVVILRGYVTSAKVEPHPQLTSLMTVVVSMSVSETVKGTPRKSLGIDHLKAVPFIEVDRPHRSRPRADQHRPACQLPQVG